MKTIKVKYEAIKYRGEKTEFIHEHKVPYFEEKIYQHTQELDGIVKKINLTTSIEEQEDEYIANIDKIHILSKYDLNYIFNFEIIRSNKELLSIERNQDTKNEDIFYAIANELIEDVELKTASIIAYKDLKHTIEDLNFEKQFRIVLASTGLAAKAATIAYQNIIDIHKRFKVAKIEYKDEKNFLLK